MPDIRDRAVSQRWWAWHDGRIAEMEDYTQGEDDDGEPIHIPIPVKMQVCPTCGGRGHYVNPNIDRQGLSREDFDAEPGFYDDYRSGMFDIQCQHCLGANVIPWPTQVEHIQLVQERLGMNEAWDDESDMERRFGA